MAAFHSFPAKRKSIVTRIPPWMIVGSALILILVIAILAVGNVQREREHMSKNLMDRAESLMWSVEAGTRANMGVRPGRQSVQALLDEAAKQLGVVYIAVTNESGKPLASSSRHPVDPGFDRVKGLHVDNVPHWRNVTLPSGERVFEVYRTFAPVPGFHDHLHHAPGHDDCPEDTGNGASHDEETQGGDTAERLITIVGLDTKPYEEALKEDLRNSVVTGIVLTVLALGGFISMFWAQHYRQSRRLLQDTRAIASEVVANMPSGLITVDGGNTITMVNSVAANLFGISAEHLAGRSLTTLPEIPWEDIAGRLDKGERVYEDEYLIAVRDGTPVPVSVSASPIVNDEQVSLGTLYLVEDIRERKRVQEQLRRSERLSALGQMAARVAHEIRNPLSSLKGFARYLADKTQPGSGREIALTMMDEMDRLNRVVTELLDFARPSPMTFTKGDIRDAVNRAMRLTEDDAGKKGIEVSFTASELPSICMDFERLTQVFINLFINAIQAMGKGGKLTVTASLAEEGRIQVTVADTGPGLPVDVQDKIFLPYFTTKPQGTGLGLAIVMKIVEEHGGEIRVTSAPDQGTIFMLLLPIDQAHQG